MTKTWCVGCRHYSDTINENIFEKVNPRTKKLVKILEGKCNICNRNKSQIFSKSMTRGQNFTKNAKCTHGHRSAMSNSAWCDLNINCTVLKLHDFCLNPKCKCQKQITFSPNQFQLEGGSIKSKLKSIFRGTKTAWEKFIKPGLKIATPLISTAVAAKTKNPQSAQVANTILKSLTGGKILSLTDMHGRGLRLKVM